MSIVSALEYRSGAILRTITQWRIQFESLALEYDLRANIRPPARYYPSSCPFRIVVGASTTSHRRCRCRQIFSFFAFNTAAETTDCSSLAGGVCIPRHPTYLPTDRSDGGGGSVKKKKKKQTMAGDRAASYKSVRRTPLERADNKMYAVSTPFSAVSVVRIIYPLHVIQVVG